MKIKLLHTLLVPLTAAFAINAHAETRLAFGATNAQSAHYAYFASIKKVVEQHNAEYKVSIIETGATVDNLRRMDRGQLDIGLITSNVLHKAYYGQDSFTRPIKSQLLWTYNPAPQNIIVRQDCEVNSLEGLTGIRIGPGMRGSATEATTLAIMKTLNIEPEWVRGSNGELANGIKDNRVCGMVKSSVGNRYDALTTDIGTFTPLTAIGLSENQVKAINENHPEVAIVDMPGDKLVNRGPYKTWGFVIGVSASPKLDTETAYNIVKSVMEDKVEQATAFPAVKGENLIEQTLKYATSPLHPGAIKYFQEQGYEVPANLIEG
ncbi:TAXI family TRAP transporter solute-binding subunit [Vibrio cholerae]|uniref:TAXI family TRAP transporter solute-binding subunit n=1 Tax=Vibrio cholerae TaxID=666 RepID=UPI001C9D640C|nr:TAXI family TRAP transporter solute-binding subunit [Vibrio cholerae]EGR4314270.1 TAXI family TRAP transporter solute-binding subunit [Vibrio cholerae]MBY8105088.1 TAXI family TRAP transporter solute-binding subunit [Vibrio fluvialis]